MTSTSRTPGFEAEPADVQAMMENLCGDDLADPDWLVRYTRLTAQQALLDAVVSAIKAERGKALAEGRNTVSSLEKIAEATGLGTYQRVQQIIGVSADRCAHTGCTSTISVVAGGIGYCSIDHAPAELRATIRV